MKQRKIKKEADELICTRAVEFKELKPEDTDPDFDNCIRVFGSHANATLQLRGLTSLTGRKGGKKRRLMATASFLDKKEVRALIAQLQEIEPTLNDK